MLKICQTCGRWLIAATHAAEHVYEYFVQNGKLWVRIAVAGTLIGIACGCDEHPHAESILPLRGTEMVTPAAPQFTSGQQMRGLETAENGYISGQVADPYDTVVYVVPDELPIQSGASYLLGG